MKEKTRFELKKNDESKISVKQKYLQKFYSKICEESSKLQSVVKNVGKNLENNVKKINSVKSKCTNCLN